MYWDVVESMFKERSLVQQNIDSFNEFIKVKIPRYIKENATLRTLKEGMYLQIHNIRVEKPIIREADGSKHPLYPMEARLRQRTYEAPIFADMSLIENDTEKDRDEVIIGNLPIMVKSEFCHLHGLSEDELIRLGEDPEDPGGYFIVNGNERVIVSIEEIAPNRILVNVDEKGGKKIGTAIVISKRLGFRAKVTLQRNAQGYYTINFPASPSNLNLFILLIALGLDTEEKILSAFTPTRGVINDVLLNLEKIKENISISQKDALDYLGKRVAPSQPEDFRMQRAEQLLDRMLLPHFGITPDQRLRKAYFLARMAERTARVVWGEIPADDRDHYANKRLSIVGDLLLDIFIAAFERFIKSLNIEIERAYSRGKKIQLRTLVNPDQFNTWIRNAMNTGNWTNNRTGVSQILDKTSHIAKLSNLTRVVSPLKTEQEHFEARDLHPTHFGKLCPFETPDGPPCGLRKNLALGAYIVPKTYEGLEKEWEKLGVELIEK